MIGRRGPSLVVLTALLSGCSADSRPAEDIARKTTDFGGGITSPATMVQESQTRESGSTETRASESGEFSLVTLYPEASQETREFLAWADGRFAVLTGIELDESGDCTDLVVHPCYAVSDDELDVISRLKRLKLLAVYARKVTERGVRHLEGTPSLRKLHLWNPVNVPDEALARLKQSNPHLELVEP